MSTLLRREVVSEASKVDGSDRVRAFVLSTPTVDRYDSTIALNGWRLEQFQRNPVALAFHNDRQPAIGRWRNVGVRDGALRGELEFFEASINPMSEQLMRMVDLGVLGVSVGFAPVSWAYNEGRGWYAIDYLEQELLEASVVNVGGNADALLEGRSLVQRPGVDLRHVFPPAALDERGALRQRDQLTFDSVRAAVRAAFAVPPHQES